MRIPLLNEMGIPFFQPIEEKGFLEVGFKPIYNPGILVCDKNEANPQDLPIACKGVLILVDTPKSHIYVGEGGVGGEKSLLSGNIPSRFRRVWYGDANTDDKIPGWDRAILLFDWENDIKVDRDKKAFLLQVDDEASSEESDEEKAAIRVESKIDELMKEEVRDLRRMLLFELNNLNNFHLTNSTAQNSDPKFNSRRYDYYVAVIKELLRIITGQ